MALEVDSEWAGEKHESDDTSNGYIMKTCRCLRLSIYFFQLMSLRFCLTAAGAKLVIQRPPLFNGGCLMWVFTALSRRLKPNG
ncbi:hypothetical protein EGH10_13655 [Brevibacillus laterosporus]|uniref:hypothetical protein n=1 Tax=Brevibacillus laterosporus TaxID=1465 RepID=UPI0005A1ED50|nr:hypothetical protein [Brevibacillus laterosporus]RJL11511.1 hypothetical protein DM460_10215 [Brevibacillus laterosporus]TPH09329.1 hypothetical protein EGH10_13655 [Brevibacillus laterosporus]